jgi:coproporphyrinogen III oxidase-like Fe-S oxidoreductase
VPDTENALEGHDARGDGQQQHARAELGGQPIAAFGHHPRIRCHAPHLRPAIDPSCHFLFRRGELGHESPGAEARHNLAYWRGDPYLGLGAAAVGCTPERDRPTWASRWRNVYDVPGYLAALADGRHPPEEREPLDPETRAREALLLGLRAIEGVETEGVRARTGVDLRATRARAWDRELRAGNVREDGVRWSIPAARWLQADGITARLF